MVRDTVVNKLNEHEVNDQEYRIYTTLDPDLQRAAAQAVETGIKLVDDQVTKMRTPQDQGRRQAGNHRRARSAGASGTRRHGSAYRRNQSARRRTKLRNQPVESRARQAPHWLHLQTVRLCRRHEYRHRRLDHRDHPGLHRPRSASTFSYGDQIYEPRNYKEEYHGDVTLRYALAMSLNNATVKLAEEVGYDKVADLARSAGIASVKATPAMALGAYDATPLT